MAIIRQILGFVKFFLVFSFDAPLRTGEKYPFFHGKKPWPALFLPGHGFLRSADGGSQNNTDEPPSGLIDNPFHSLLKFFLTLLTNDGKAGTDAVSYQLLHRFSENASFFKKFCKDFYIKIGTKVFRTLRNPSTFVEKARRWSNRKKVFKNPWYCWREDV